MTDIIKKNVKTKYLYIFLLALIGIVLVMTSQPKTKNKESPDVAQSWNHEYISMLESRIEFIISTIKDAGNCNVMINVVSTEESVYVKESKKASAENKTESEDSILTMTDSDGNQYAVVTKKIMPEISGVIISCDGGDLPSVKSEITKAVSTLLGIGSNNICVTANNI